MPGTSGERTGATSLWPTRWAVVVAVVSWAASGLYLIHWGKHWELDLRVYHAAGRAYFAGHSPYDLLFTSARLPYTYPPFGLLVTSVVGFGSAGVVDVSFWVVNGVAAVCTVYAALRLCRLPGGGAPGPRRRPSAGWACSCSSRPAATSTSGRSTPSSSRW